MNKDQLSFLASGILFGFLVGYVIAYAVHEPRVKERAAPVPAAGNLGMTPAAGGIGGPAPAPANQSPEGDQMMARVFQEIAALRETIEKDPNNVDALVRLANFFQDAGKFDEAIDYYGRALVTRPDDVDARTDMAICLREIGKTDEAIEQFRSSLSHDPRHWQSWLNLGIVSLYDKNDVVTAAAAFGKVEELNPEFRDLPRLMEAVRKAREEALRNPS